MEHGGCRNTRAFDAALTEEAIRPKELVQSLRELSLSPDADMGQAHALKGKLLSCLEELRDLRIIDNAVEAVSRLGLKSAADLDLLHGLVRTALQLTNTKTVALFVAVLCEFAVTEAKMPDKLFCEMCRRLAEVFKVLSVQDLSRLFWAFGMMVRTPDNILGDEMAKFLVTQLRISPMKFDAGALCNLTVALDRLPCFPQRTDVMVLVLARFEAVHATFNNKQLVDMLEALANSKVLVSLTTLSQIFDGLIHRQVAMKMNPRQTAQLLYSLFCLGCKFEASLPNLVRSVISTGLAELSATHCIRLIFVLNETKNPTLIKEFLHITSDHICAGLQDVGFDDFRDLIATIASSVLSAPALRAALVQKAVNYVQNLNGRDLSSFISLSADLPDMLRTILKRINDIKSLLVVSDIEKSILALSLSKVTLRVVDDIADLLCTQLGRVRDKLDAFYTSRILKGLGDIKYRPANDVMMMLASKCVQLAPRLNATALSCCISGFSRLEWFESPDGTNVFNALAHEVTRRGGDYSSRDAAQLFVDLCPHCSKYDPGGKESMANILLRKILSDMTLPSSEDLVGVLSSLARDNVHHLRSPSAIKILQFLSNQGLGTLSGGSVCRLLLVLAGAGVNPLPSAMPSFVDRIRDSLPKLSAQDVCTALCSLADLGAEPSYETTIDFAVSALKPFTARTHAEWCRDWENGPRCGIVGDSCDALWSLAVLHSRWCSCRLGQTLMPIASDALRSVVRPVLKALSGAFFATFADGLDLPETAPKIASLHPLYRLYAFFSYLHINYPEGRKLLVDSDDNTFKMAGICHCTFINSSRDSVPDPTITASEVKLYSAEIGLQFEFGSSLEDCGYVPSLLNCESKLILEIGESEQIIVGPEGEAFFRGAQKLKIRHLLALGWEVVSFTRIEWERIARREGYVAGGLLRKSFLLQKLGSHVAVLKIGIHDWDDNIAAGELTVCALERLYCSDGHLLKIRAQSLPNVLEKMLEYPQQLMMKELDCSRAHQRMSQLLVPGGLEERVSSAAAELDLPSLVRLMDSVSKFANVLCGIWQSKQLLSVLAELCCTKMGIGHIRADLLSQIVSICGTVHGHIDIEFFNSLVLGMLDACTAEVLESLHPTIIVMIFFVACKVRKYCESRPEAANLHGSLAARASRPDVMASLDERDLPLMVGACNQLNIFNSQLSRALAERAHELLCADFKRFSPSQLVFLVHGLASLDLGLEATLELLHRQILSSAFLEALSSHEVILLIWVYAKVVSEDQKAVKSLIKRFLLIILNTDELCRLSTEELVDFLWSLAVHCLVSPAPFDGSLWNVQIRMCERVVSEWKAGRLYLVTRCSETDHTPQPLCARRTSMLRQYLVAVQQNCSTESFLLQPDFICMSSEIIKFSVSLDKRPELSGVRQGIRESLMSLGVETEEGLVLNAIGYIVCLKLRNQATAVEIYGRADSVEIQRDKHPRPGGAWSLRKKQLGAAGLMVISVGYDQWEGLLVSQSAACRAEWLQKLLAASSWATNLGPSATIAGGELRERRAKSDLQQGAGAASKHSRQETVSPFAQERNFSASPVSLANTAEESNVVNSQTTMVSESCPAVGWLDAKAREDAVLQTKKRIKVTVFLPVKLASSLSGLCFVKAVMITTLEYT